MITSIEDKSDLDLILTPNTKVKTMVESIIFCKNKLKFLDQLRLPSELHYENIEDVTDAWNAIHSMKGKPSMSICLYSMASLRNKV